MGGVNLLMHGAGWMEGGLHAELREDDPRRRAARDGRGVPRPGRRRRGHPRLLGDAGGRPGRPLLRRRAHPVALPDRVPQADAQRLAQLRDLAGGRLARGCRQGQPHLEGAPRGLRAAADGPGDRARSSRRSSPAASPRAASPPTTDARPEEPREVIGPGRRHRRWRGRRQRAVPPDEGRLDRRRAARATRADRRLDVARGRRHAHAQRRPERRPSSSSTRSSSTRRSSGSPARTARSTCRAG